MKRVKIAYLTSGNPFNKHSWSGTDFYIRKNVQQFIGEVEVVNPKPPVIQLFIAKFIHFIALYFFRKRYDWRHDKNLSKAYANKVSKAIHKKQYDFIIAPASELIFAFLKTDIPIVYINDRTIFKSINYHKIFTNLLSFSKRQSIELDKQAIEKSLFTIYPSKWAVQSAVDDYKIDPEKLLYAPFGANIDEIPNRDLVLRKTKPIECKLLFIGVDWEGKGGIIAFNCLLELLRMNVNASLTIVGCQPPKEIFHSKLTVIPFLNKNISAEFEQLKNLWLTSSFLILPTRIDAFGIVFCEAAAYGLPSLGTNTGGVAGAIHEGKTGFLMPFEADGSAYAKKIIEIYGDENLYNNLIVSCRNTFEETLNWEKFVKTLYQKFEESNQTNSKS